jgi:hypothetical protein
MFPPGAALSVLRPPTSPAVRRQAQRSPAAPSGSAAGFGSTTRSAIADFAHAVGELDQRFEADVAVVALSMCALGIQRAHHRVGSKRIAKIHKNRLSSRGEGRHSQFDRRCCHGTNGVEQNEKLSAHRLVLEVEVASIATSTHQTEQREVGKRTLAVERSPAARSDF